MAQKYDLMIYNYQMKKVLVKINVFWDVDIITKS